MEEKRKVRFVNIVVILIDILLLGVICGNHCRLPDQVMIKSGNDDKIVKMAMLDN